MSFGVPGASWLGGLSRERRISSSAGAGLSLNSTVRLARRRDNKYPARRGLKGPYVEPYVERYVEPYVYILSTGIVAGL